MLALIVRAPLRTQPPLLPTITTTTTTTPIAASATAATATLRSHVTAAAATRKNSSSDKALRAALEGPVLRPFDTATHVHAHSVDEETAAHIDYAILNSLKDCASDADAAVLTGLTGAPNVARRVKVNVVRGRLSEALRVAKQATSTSVGSFNNNDSDSESVARTVLPSHVWACLVRGLGNAQRVGDVLEVYDLMARDFENAGEQLPPDLEESAAVALPYGQPVVSAEILTGLLSSRSGDNSHRVRKESVEAVARALETGGDVGKAAALRLLAQKQRET